MDSPITNQRLTTELFQILTKLEQEFPISVAYYFLNIAVCWSSSWARILNVRDKIRKELRRQVKMYLQRVSLLPPSLELANIHSILDYDVPRTEDVGLYPPNSGSMLSQRFSQLLVQCRSIVYDAGPTLIHH